MMKKLLMVIALCASSMLLAQDYYVILGVPRDATEAQIKAAYKKLALKFHPDKVRARLQAQKPPLSPEAIQEAVGKAEEEFKQISNANDILKDPAKRHHYDQELQRQQKPTGRSITEAELKGVRSFLNEIVKIHKNSDFSGAFLAVFMLRQNIAGAYAKFIDSLKQWKPDNRINELAIIARGLFNLVQQDPLNAETQQRLDAIKAQIQQRLQMAPSLAQPEARLKTLETLEDEYWLWTYLDQQLRNQIVTEVIALVRALQHANKQAAARQLIDKTLKAIDQEWGRNFPVNPALREQLEQLRATRPAPQKKRISPSELVRVENFIKAGMYSLAIDELKEYQPETNAKIVNTYIQYINNARPEQKLKILTEADRFAQEAIGQFRKLGITNLQQDVPKFNEAYQALRDLAQQLRAPAPQPLPRPKPNRIPEGDLIRIKQMTAANMILRAIAALNEYTDSAKVQIIDSYISDIQAAQNPVHKLSLLDDALKLAQAIQADLQANNRMLPIFNEAYGRLQKLAAQVRAAQPIPPAVSTQELAHNLQTLQQQLDALSRQLGMLGR
jgi:anion-transporting  ArsA/GET3 family ATPase